MPEGQSFFEKREVRGHPEYSVTNHKLGITMKIEPLPGVENHRIVRRKNIAEITFVNNSNIDGERRDTWFDWPYIITEADIESVDVSDPDFIEEVFSKYGRKFISLESFKYSSELSSLNFLDRADSRKASDAFRDFLGKIFPDIEEKRKAEERKE